MGDPVGALASILPPGAVAAELVEGEGDDFTWSLHAEELGAVDDAAEGRRREFAAGRMCGRLAMERLGVPPGPLPPRGNGAPVWPAGIVGSITHKGRYRAAAVAFSHDLAGLGIDAELDAPLPAGVLESIASPVELDDVEGLLAEVPGVAWDRLLFSAKEAAVKAARPLGDGLVAVRSVEVRFDSSAPSFTAGLGDGDGRVNGSWVALAGMLVSAAYVA